MSTYAIDYIKKKNDQLHHPVGAWKFSQGKYVMWHTYPADEFASWKY